MDSSPSHLRGYAVSSPSVDSILHLPPFCHMARGCCVRETSHVTIAPQCSFLFSKPCIKSITHFLACSSPPRLLTPHLYPPSYDLDHGTCSITRIESCWTTNDNVYYFWIIRGPVTLSILVRRIRSGDQKRTHNLLVNNFFCDPDFLPLLIHV